MKKVVGANLTPGMTKLSSQDKDLKTPLGLCVRKGNVNINK